jgi:predicted acyltransferase
MENKTKTTNRLLSLDTLRGFDMFWITGGSNLFRRISSETHWAWADYMYNQLEHPAWNGFHFYDLIFPLFIFMAGVSTPFSFDALLAKGTSRKTLLVKAVRRGLILVLLGILYNNGFFHQQWEQMRYPSVLGRIGLAGMFAQIIYLYSSRRGVYITIPAILLGYWAIMALVPVPGCGAGMLTRECNPASYLDSILFSFGGHQVTHDPEGVLSTLPAIATCLIGICAGLLLKADAGQMDKNQKVSWLMIAGLAGIIAGILWDGYFPINKNLWTSSFTLLTAGLSLILLGLFYWIIDVRGYTRWTFFFVVIGTNSIVIYMAKKFIHFSYTAEALFGGIFRFFPESVGKIGLVAAFIAIQWTFIYLLYKRKLFLKI